MQNVNRFPSSKLKLDEFFLNWLSSPESQKLVRPIPTPPPFPDRRLPPAVVSATPCARSPNPRSTSRARDAPRASPSPPLPPTMFIL